MPSPKGGLRIWKHSHGTNKTTPDWSNDDRERFKAEHVLKIFANTKRGQIQHFHSMRPGDFFLLCHGNDIQLLGRVETGLLNPRSDPRVRKYTVVCRLEGGPWKFRGHRKGWSPGGNTTCWPVPEEEHATFQNDILRPFFGLTLNDLARRQLQPQLRPQTESEELLPPPRNPRPYRGHRGHARPECRGGHARFYDPDKTGHRAEAHDRCLDRFARMFRQSKEYQGLSEDDYDLVVSKGKSALLVEAKTLRGDERRQLRLALGQLLFYEHLSVERQFPGCKVFRLIVTDQPAPGYLVKLLERYRVGVVSLPEGKPVASALGTRFLRRFGATLRPG